MASDPTLSARFSSAAPATCTLSSRGREEAGAAVPRGFKEFGTSVTSTQRAEHGQRWGFMVLLLLWGDFRFHFRGAESWIVCMITPRP